MQLAGVKIGFALTGSFYVIKPIIEQIKELVKMGAEVLPVMSFNAYNVTTRYGTPLDFIGEIEEITKHKVVSTFVEAEAFNSRELVDIIVIAPCTGNTLAKLANRYNRYTCFSCCEIWAKE